MDPDPKIHIPAALAFMKYDSIASFLISDTEFINEMLEDKTLILGVARMFAYYTKHDFFISQNQILENLHKIRHLPLRIIHGRYDIICLLRNAYELHQNWPGSELIIVPDAGHSAREPGIAKEFIVATKRFANNE